MSMSGQNPYTPFMSRIISLFRQNPGPVIVPYHYSKNRIKYDDKPRPCETTYPHNDMVASSQTWGYFVDPDDETKMPTKLPELKRHDARSNIDSSTKHHHSTSW